MVTLEATRLLADLLLRAGDVRAGSPAGLPSQAKNLKGRPKTDKLTMWLARLTEWGMLRPASCRPPRSGRCGITPCPHRPGPGTDPVLAAAGEAARRRADQAVQRGQQADHSVRAGHDHGDDRRGTRPGVLADMAQTRMRARHDALVEALTGMFDSHHGELAEMELDQIAFLNERIGKLEASIRDTLAAIPAAQGVNADGTTGPDAGRGRTRLCCPPPCGWRRSPASASRWPRRSSPRPAWT